MTIATLTGAIDVALGNVYSGIWMSNNAQRSWISNAAQAAGEPIWQMPFHFEYLWNIEKTPIADIKNIGNRSAGSCTAAEFLKYFAPNANFIHADIASTNVFKDHPRAVLLRTMYFLAKDFK
jgi:leucyl aminopeptidase